MNENEILRKARELNSRMEVATDRLKEIEFREEMEKLRAMHKEGATTPDSATRRRVTLVGEDLEIYAPEVAEFATSLIVEKGPGVE